MRPISAVLLSLVVSACGTASPSPAAPSLDGREFLSTSVTEAGEDRPLVDGTRIRLRFEPGGRIGASAGCNQLGGSYRLDAGRLLLADAAVTELGCDPDLHAQDEFVFGFLGSRPSVTLNGNELVLERDGVVITLIDRAVAEPDLPLFGTTWTVDTIVAGDAASSVPGGVVATLEFTADGQVHVNTGCNQGNATFRVEPERFRLIELVLTGRACAGAAGQMEAAVLAVLNAGEVGYSVDASTLTLTANGAGLVLRGS